MRREIVDKLRDPITTERFFLKVIEEKDGEIISGWLGSSRGEYPIVQGVPCLFDAASLGEEQWQTIDSFSSKWEMAPDYREDTSEFYWQWYLERYANGYEDVLKVQLEGATTILDAGTGLGRDAEHFQQRTDADIFAVDLSEGIHLAYERLHHTGIHFIRCDIAHLPFEPGFFDFISCDQVLHHTPNPPETLAHLATRLSPAATLNFYVYKKKAPMREMCDDYLREKTSTYLVGRCRKFSEQLADIGRQLTEIDRSIVIDSDIPELGIKADTYDLQRFFYWHFIKMFYNADFSWEDNIAVNFDWYHPACAKRYSWPEVNDMIYRADLSTDYFHVSDAGYSVRTRRSE